MLSIYALYKVLSTSSSEYLNESVHYEIELYDTTSDQNINICHQLVFMGIAKGEAYCLQVGWCFSYLREPYCFHASIYGPVKFVSLFSPTLLLCGQFKE